MPTVLSFLLLAMSAPTVVDVRDFGAKADGKTDLSTAFQAAHDALPESGGTIQIPAGPQAYVVVADRPTIRNPKVGLKITKPNVFVVGTGGTPTIRMKGMTKAYLDSIDDASSSGRDVFSAISFVVTTGGGVSNLQFVGEWDGRGKFRYKSPRAKAVAIIGSSGTVIEDVQGEGILGNLVNVTASGQGIEKVFRLCENVRLEKIRAVRCLENGVNFMGGSRRCSIADSQLENNGSTGVEAGGADHTLTRLVCQGNGYAGVSLSGKNQTLLDSKLIANGNTERNDAGFGLVVMQDDHRIERVQMIGNAHYGVYVYPNSKGTRLAFCEVRGNSVGPDASAVAEIRLAKGSQVQIVDTAIESTPGRTVVQGSLRRVSGGIWRLEDASPAAELERLVGSQMRCADPRFIGLLESWTGSEGRVRVVSGAAREGLATLVLGSRARIGVYSDSGAKPQLERSNPKGYSKAFQASD